MNTKNHLPNIGSFKKGLPDKRRNNKGQLNGAAVALSAQLKQCLAAEGGRPAGKGKQSKVEALAGKIWERALQGDFQFTQFLVERFLGKVRAELAIVNDEAIDFGNDKLTIEVVHTRDGKPLSPAEIEAEGMASNGGIG